VRIALDTNMLAYAEGVNGLERKQVARAILAHLPQESLVLPVQVLGELCAVLVRKAGWPAERARAAVLEWRAAYDVIETSAEVLQDGLELMARHRFGVWDGIILAAAAKADCRYLLSEDMQDGFCWRGIMIANPFASNLPPPLAALLNRGGKE
jgi:predicted nucleic acid-binding protein